MTARKSFFSLLFTLLLILTGGCSNENDSLSGYIEGEYTYIASGIPGTLIKLNVTRGQPVKKDELLYILDQQPDLAFMQAAHANVEQLIPQVAFAKKQMERQKDLYAHNVTSKELVDQTVRDYDSLTKQLQSSEKALTQAEWSLQQKTIYSPVTGSVFDTFFRIGEKVAANQPVLAILTPDNIKVLFYIPENKLSTIHLGQTIYFTCDGCQKTNTAVISYISPEAEYTPPIIYSQDTRYKLVYLVRASISLTQAKQFHPGQPLDISLHE